MTRQFGCAVLAFSLFATAALLSEVQAQSITVGGGGIRYNAYGRGYYGGYGGGYNGYFPGNARHQGYGNGPYGYGSGSAMFIRPGIGYQNSEYYNGYGSGFYNRNYTPIYSPYGYGTYSSYRW